MYQIKITIANETPYHLFMPSEPDVDGSIPDFVIDPPAYVVPGSSLPPKYLSPHSDTSNPDPDAPPSRCNIALCSPATPVSPATTASAPSGSLRLVLSAAKHEILLQWRDFSIDQEAGPASCTSQRLDDGFGELDLSCVTQFLTEGGKESPTKTKTLAVSLIVKLIDRTPDPALFERKRIVMPRVAMHPTGGGKTVVGKTYRRWNDPDLTAKRRMVLAYLGCMFPMKYQGDNEKYSHLKNVQSPQGAKGMPWNPISLVGWFPGDPHGTTSCVNVNGNIETKLTGRTAYWAFEQYKLEDAWVPCGANPVKKMPNVGDPYFLYRDKGDGKTVIPRNAHVGFILHVPENENERWVTADGGQFPGGSTAFLNLKKWEWRIPELSITRRQNREHPVPQGDPRRNKPEWAIQQQWEQFVKGAPYANPIEDTKYIYMAGGAESDPENLGDAKRVIGWLDLDMISFKSLELGAPIEQGKAKSKENRRGLMFHQDMDSNLTPNPTINDYWFIGSWIDKLLADKGLPTTGSPTKVEDWIAHINAPLKNPVPTVPNLDPQKSAASQVPSV